ncbi:NDT80/PhoG like DNA-binding family protein [Xylariaceae sp. FL0255]|nr:NDT80/PhoG like DNA-binding family protein [Xylariaceae sp. FL0255]
MADLKSEPTHGSLWPSYGAGAVLSSSRFPSTLDSAAPTTSTSPHGTRPRSSHPSIDNPYPFPRYSHDEHDAYERYPQASLTQHQSYPNLKRSHHRGDSPPGQQPPPPPLHPPYQEIVQDLRDDAKLTVNHDHKLLSFRRVQDKHTIVDQHGRMQGLDLSAQLHGMFFLSEMPTTAGDGAVLQPELTCYRRNLFQISGSLITPRGQMSVILAETGEQVHVNNTDVTISAIESVDSHPVRLIVIPWKTPPPNSPELPQTPDQEPQSLPLIPFPEDGQDAEGEYAVYPIGWRRLQFRIATANNGRRKELQQHFVLHLKVVGSLANGSRVTLAEATTAPIVVRGRSPRNFQARKEIPLLGSSAGSRGQALVETGLGIVAGPLPVKPQDTKLRGLNLELPRTAFTFNPGKMPGSPMAMRANSYPNWTPSNHLGMHGLPSSATSSYPPSTIPSDPYQKLPISGTSAFTQDSSDMPLQTSIPPAPLSLASTEQPASIRTQYAAYIPGTSAPSQIPPPPATLGSTGGNSEHSASSIPRYVDPNPRPSKSPRHGAHQSIPSTSSLINNDSASEYRFGPPQTTTYESTSSTYGATSAESAGSISAISSTGAAHSSAQAPPRDYYPPASSWTTTASENSSVNAYHNGTTGGESRPYSFPDQYKTGHSMSVKTEQPPPSASYASSMHHYAWSPT